MDKATNTNLALSWQWGPPPDLKPQSSFINSAWKRICQSAVGREKVQWGHHIDEKRPHLQWTKLELHGHEPDKVCCYEAPYKDIGGNTSKIILLDTPGFDDTSHPDREVLQEICKHLDHEPDLGEHVSLRFLEDVYRPAQSQGIGLRVLRFGSLLCCVGSALLINHHHDVLSALDHDHGTTCRGSEVLKVLRLLVPVSSYRICMGRVLTMLDLVEHKVAQEHQHFPCAACKSLLTI